MRATVIPAFLLLFSCGSPDSKAPDPGTPSDRPIQPTPRPTPTATSTPSPHQRIKHRPSWISPEWSDTFFYVGEGETGNFGILPGQEDIADSWFEYWQAIRKDGKWHSSIVVGIGPDAYLKKVPKTPDGIKWTDATKGTIPGFEKLPPVLTEMQKRCPTLSDPNLQAPLEVVWATAQDSIASGQFTDNFLALGWENEKVVLTANSNLRPKMFIRAEYVKDFGTGHSDGYRFPKQTFKEQTGGKSYADGGFTWKSIDQTFAHEYGHFLLQAWALNHGRSNLQSQWFAEGWAEFVRSVCWGSLSDNPVWAESDVEMNTREDGVPYSQTALDYIKYDHRFARQSEYDLLSLGNLITWLIHNKRFNPDLLLRTGLLALSKVKGRYISWYPVISPVDGILTDRSPWANSSSFLHPEIAKDVPPIITRSEWLENFCPSLEELGGSCEHLKANVEADAHGQKRDEW